MQCARPSGRAHCHVGTGSGPDRGACLLYTDGVALTPTTGWGVLHLFLPAGPRLRRQRPAQGRERRRGGRLPGGPRGAAGPQGGPGPDGARPRHLAAAPPADRGRGVRSGGRRVLRVADRGLRVRRRGSRGDAPGPALPPAAARGQGRLLLLPDEQAPRRAAQLVRPGLRRPQGADDGSRQGGADVPRPGGPGHHRLDRARRLRVGRDVVRRPPRRPEGLRLRDALRRGVGPATPSSAPSTPAWWARSTTCCRSWAPERPMP